MTIESDSGYSPMALAVALGHKKSTYCLLISNKCVIFLQEATGKMLCRINTSISFVSSSKSVGGPYSETLQVANMTRVKVY